MRPADPAASTQQADGRAAADPSGAPSYDGGRSAIVRLDGVVAGRLTESADRRFMLFRYDEAYLDLPDAVPVSLTLPLTREPTETWGLHPFFLNLAPEGWLRELAVRKLRVHETDEFGLLVATGADCAGAVEVLPDHGPEDGGMGGVLVAPVDPADHGVGDPPDERDSR